MDQMYIFAMQVLLALGIAIGSQSLGSDDKSGWALTIARYIVYILTIQGTKGLSVIAYDVFHNKRGLDVRLLQRFRLQILMFLVSIAVLMINSQNFFAEDFPLIFIACLIVKYPEIEKKTISPANYGVGMACSFYEGYLMHVIPSDGGSFGGIEQNISAFESSQGVVVPVKKLFIVITKSLYSPPDLGLFNKDLPGLAKLEACRIMPYQAAVDPLFQSLENVTKDMAGVKNRIYKNSAYKIYRAGARPVCLVAECATPLHTLHRVMENRELYEELADVNVEDVVNDFCSTLTTILGKSSECRDKVVLVYFDDENKDLNLADVLLDKIRELEPNFEELISVEQ